MMRRWVATMAVLAVLGMVAGCGGASQQTAEPAGGGATAEDHGHAHGTPEAPGGAIAIEVTEDGFVPAEIRVPHGQQVTLVVTRKTEKTCATEFVMKSHGINQKLPMNEAVTISFTPTETGELRYACGMDMIAGKVIVE